MSVALPVPPPPPVTARPPAAAPAPAPAPATQPPPARHHAWWIAPLVIVAVAGIALLLLMGLPFGGDDADDGPRISETETIAEGAPVPSREPAATGTLIDVNEEPPAAITRPRVEPSTPVSTPAPAPAPTPARTPAATPPPARPATTEISESEAISTLRGFINSRNYYDTGADCIGVSSRGYENVGYTLEVSDTCNSRSLGRWRVDSKTREIFRQREDGRFLRP